MAVLETPTILAIEALETCFCRSIRISSSLPSSLDLPSPPLGAAAQSALGACRPDFLWTGAVENG